ncbi:MAG: cytidylyltransferase [SAR202 cluster bacterium]|jgi:CMP-N-acetylneuraminic acid synthetase|nr:cytidylyltransferase [SAR202 cluster bacterium]|tara:strand:- start:711 stop:1463 length:753 start_codon:yes stop_codon:yes gene_type:complete
MKKNCALLIGKHNSGSVPGKNYMEILGRPAVEYPLLAASHCDCIDKIYVSTDSPVIMEIASRYDAEIIDRPAELARADSPTEFVFQHAYEIISKREPELGMMALLFANSLDVLPEYLEKGFRMLTENDDYDSVVSICQYNMFTPLRARRLNIDSTTEPILELEKLGIENAFDRDAMGDVYFVDFGVQVVRPERCLKDPLGGALPFRWLGHKQGAIVKDFGFDIDAEWQIPTMQFWLEKHGFTSRVTPYDV